MAPPQYNKLTKSISDLFKKDFDFGFNVKTTNKASKGLKFETAGLNTATGVAGAVKVNYDHSDFGKVETQLHTAGRDEDTNAKVTFNKLAQGVEVSISANAAPDVGVEAVYTQSQFASTLTASTNLDSGKSKAALKATVGAFSGLTLGGEMAGSLGKSGSFDVSTYDMGLLYGFDKTTLGLISSKKFDGLATSVFHKLDKETSIGVRVNSNLAKSAHTADFGLQHALSSSSSAKIKADTNGVVGISFIQNLATPNAKFSFALQRALTGTKSEKFGLGLHFGDY